MLHYLEVLVQSQNRQVPKPEYKNPPLNIAVDFYVKSVIALILVLAGSLGLLAALDARALIALALTHLRQNTGLGAASLETLQSAVQGLAFLDMDFGHLCFPPSDAPGSIQGAL